MAEHDTPTGFSNVKCPFCNRGSMGRSLYLVKYLQVWACRPCIEMFRNGAPNFGGGGDYTYEEIRSMDNNQLISAGLTSDDHLARELANRLDVTLEQLTECHRSNDEAHDVSGDAA